MSNQRVESSVAELKDEVPGVYSQSTSLKHVSCASPSFVYETFSHFSSYTVQSRCFVNLILEKDGKTLWSLARFAQETQTSTAIRLKMTKDSFPFRAIVSLLGP